MSVKIPPLVKAFMLPTSHHDPKRADRVVSFIGALHHTKGRWKGLPFRLLPRQEDLIRTVFGVIGENGCRQFRTCYVEISKKKSKTMLAAIALYLLLADDEHGAEIYSCASGRQQASMIYREAAVMAQGCPTLVKADEPTILVARIAHRELARGRGTTDRSPVFYTGQAREPARMQETGGLTLPTVRGLMRRESVR